MDANALILAQAALAQRKYPDLVMLTESWQNEPSGEGAKLRAMGLLGSGRAQDALLVFPTAAQKLPDDQVVAFAYGQANMQTNQLEAAKECFEQLLKLNAAHPGAKKAIETACGRLATRDEKQNPMQAITWLYRSWELEPGDAAVSARILQLYLNNGWQDAGLQFAGQLTSSVKSHPSVQQLLAKMQPPAAGAGAANAHPGFEACPFCKQQVMAGVANCPHCKMAIRTSVFNASKIRPEWQTVTLNVLCVLGVVLNVVQMIVLLVNGAHGTKAGGWELMMSGISISSCGLVLMRVEWAMMLAKWYYVLSCATMGFCGCASLGLIGFAKGEEAAAAISIIIIFALSGMYGFMAYLIHYEDQ